MPLFIPSLVIIFLRNITRWVDNSGRDETENREKECRAYCQRQTRQSDFGPLEERTHGREAYPDVDGHRNQVREPAMRMRLHCGISPSLVLR